MNILSGRTQLIDFTKDSNEILVEHFHPKHFEFEKSDTEKNFQKNLKTQPHHWYYRSNAVTYTLNGQMYRCKPFNEINWSESIVIFGCSNVFGDAVDDSHTLSARLQELVNSPVINLGVAGSCQLTSLYNMMTLKNSKIKPKAVIHAWTDSMRVFYVNNQFQRCGVGNWNNWGANSDIKFDMFTNSKTHIISAMFNRMIADNIYSDIPVIHATYFKHMWAEQRSMYPNSPMLLLPHTKDLARDLLHPGRETNKDAAKILYNELLHRQFN